MVTEWEKGIEERLDELEKDLEDVRQVISGLVELHKKTFETLEAICGHSKRET